ncbi:MAG TPA: hypothetical protein VL286_02625 [Rhizomicrobium sp.]|nr:hypothetical protein [Rhizomicrobium sp.]
MTGRYSIAQAILLGGLIAGTIDIGAASLIFWRSPFLICQSVASGLFGRASFTGGMETTLAGLLLQWGMSLIIAAIYVAASTWVPVLRRRWVAAGLAYGVGIFFVMNYVVVPLSAVHRIPHFTARMFAENMLAMLLFGLIVAYFAGNARGAVQSQKASVPAA